MLAITDPTRLHSGDVLIHPARGGAIVDEVRHDRVFLDFTERLDRRAQIVDARELTRGWRRTLPGGLFERSVLQPEEVSAWVADHPTETVVHLAEELGSAVDRDLATTWLVSRGLLAPGRMMGWWQAAIDGAAMRTDLLVAGDRLVLSEPTMQDVSPDPAQALRALATMGVRERFDLLDRLGPEHRLDLLAEAVRAGDPATAAQILRWGDALPPDLLADLDRLLSAGERDLAVALARVAPDLAAGALLADARAHGGTGLCGDVIAALPSRRRVHLLMALLCRALQEHDGVDAVEAVIEDHVGLTNLQARVDPTQPTDPDFHVEPPRPGLWDTALHWMQQRGSESTMEMPALQSAPPLREGARLATRDAFPVSLSLARALASRHGDGLAGGVRGARLDRAEWRVDLGPAEPGDPAEDVHDAMRLVANLLVGRLAGPGEVGDATLLAHLAQLAPGLPPDWVAVAVRALDPDPSTRIPNGHALWRDLAMAAAAARVRLDSTERSQASIRIGFDTHIGAVKARLGQTNQDAVFFHRHGPLTLLLVADGISISSAGSGNLASALLVQSVATLWEEQADLLGDADEAQLHRFLRNALDAANQSVCETALRLADGDLVHNIPMGSTVVAALVRGGRAHIASLGDSRAYLATPAGLAQLTGDGNLMGEWLLARQSGQADPIQADGAALTAYVGHFDEDDAPSPLAPQQVSVTVLPGEHLLLCSDGFTDFAARDPAGLSRLVQDTLRRAPSVDTAARTLVAAANEGGGGDNITVLIAGLDA
ncbi:MAG: serine/threonine-protein phosphatase [Deltaproteobacteria bacterium]|nr:MAG: serine/threonine-protein phosphatase [Deltaproteobacteria bacterium]